MEDGWGSLDTELWALILTQVPAWTRGEKSEDYPRLSFESVRGILALLSCSKKLRDNLCADELLWKALCKRWFGSGTDRILPSYPSWFHMFMGEAKIQLSLELQNVHRVSTLWAAERGHLSLLRMKMEHYCHVLTPEQRSICCPVGGHRWDTRVLNALLGGPDDPPFCCINPWRMLIAAARFGHAHVVEHLLNDPRFLIVKQYKLQRQKLCPALQLAIYHGHAEVVRLLLSSETNTKGGLYFAALKEPDYREAREEQTLERAHPLAIACLVGDAMATKALLDHGADPLRTLALVCQGTLQPDLTTHWRPHEGKIPFAELCAREDIGTIELLLKAGLSFHRQEVDRASFPVAMAIAKTGNLDILKALVKSRADDDLKFFHILLEVSICYQPNPEVSTFLLNEMPSLRDENILRIAMNVAMKKNFIESAIAVIPFVPEPLTPPPPAKKERSLVDPSGRGRGRGFGRGRGMGRGRGGGRGRGDADDDDDDGEARPINYLHTWSNQHIIPEIPIDEGNLSLACREGKVEVVQRMLEVGWNPFNPVHNSPEGKTPLFIACNSGHLSVVKLLVQSLASKVEKEGGRLGETLDSENLLFAAAQTNRKDVAEFLLEMGASPSFRTPSGNTALSSACGNGSTEVGLLLLDRGADPSNTNFERATPLHYSCAGGSIPLIDRLLELLGDQSSSSSRKEEMMNQETTGRNQWTPFEFAWHGKRRREVIKHLLTNYLEVLDLDRLVGRIPHLFHRVCGWGILPAVTKIAAILSSMPDPSQQPTTSRAKAQPQQPAQRPQQQQQAQPQQSQQAQPPKNAWGMPQFVPRQQPSQPNPATTRPWAPKPMPQQPQQQQKPFKKAMLESVLKDRLVREKKEVARPRIYDDDSDDEDGVYSPEKALEIHRQSVAKMPLHLAARNGHVEVVKYLLEDASSKMKDDRIALEESSRLACDRGHLKVVRMLVKVLKKQHSMKDTDYLDGGGDYTYLIADLLIRASRRGDIPMVDMLLLPKIHQNRIGVNDILSAQVAGEDRRTTLPLLGWAATCKRTDPAKRLKMINHLLDHHHANPNKLLVVYDWRLTDGKGNRFLLQILIENDHIPKEGLSAIIQTLISHGAFTSHMADGPSLLCLAVAKRQLEVARVLLGAGLDVDTPQFNNKKKAKTALQLAFGESRSVDIFKLLLVNHRADWTPLIVDIKEQCFSLRDRRTMFRNYGPSAAEEVEMLMTVLGVRGFPFDNVGEGYFVGKRYSQWLDGEMMRIGYTSKGDQVFRAEDWRESLWGLSGYLVKEEESLIMTLVTRVLLKKLNEKK